MSRDVREELLQIVDAIAQFDTQIHEIRRQKDKIRDRIQMIRSELVMDIGTAKDEKGKRIYSNEKLREAALTLRLAEHEEFQELRGRLRGLDEEERGLFIEYNRLVGRREVLMLDIAQVRPFRSDRA